MLRHFLIALLLIPLVAAAPVLEETGTITMNTGDTGGLTVTFNDDNGGSSGGGGGGGGGAAGDANACFITNPGSSYSYDLMLPGTVYTLKSHTAQFMFKKITFRVQNNQSGVSFRQNQNITS